MKVNYFLRIFNGFSFLVSMLTGVFFDLKFFLGFFAIVVATFSLILSVLIPEAALSYPGTWAFSFIVMSFRTSLGDFDMDDYREGQGENLQLKGLIWIVWFLMVLVGNVIFMNFIVAVVSESYEKCMQT
jgi:hypothetical protein